VQELVEEGLAAARASGDKYALGMTLALLGTRLEMVRGDREAAHVHAEEGIALLKETGNAGAIPWPSLASVWRPNIPVTIRGACAFCDLPAPLPRYSDKHRVSMIKSELAHLERSEGHYQQAEVIYRETIVEWQSLGFRAAVAHQLECFASMAKSPQEGRRAACLFGAAEALREMIEIQMTATERIEYEREVAELRAAWMEKNSLPPGARAVG